MKLRKLVSLFLVLILALGVFSVALADSGDKPWAGKKLGVAHITMYDEWCKAVYDEFMAQAPEMGFGEINIQDGNLNAETQQKQVEDFITQGYDAILIDPVNSDGIVPALEQAGAANIPVFAFDSGSSYDKLVTHVAWDHAQTGVLTAEWIADYAKEKPGRQSPDRRAGDAQRRAHQGSLRGVCGQAGGAHGRREHRVGVQPGLRRNP